MLNESGVFMIEGVDIHNYYDSDYYGMSAYIFRYTNHGKNFLFTLPGCYFEEILKMMSESINSNYCLLLEKFIDAGLDFDFDFQNNELGGWWEIPDKNLLLENLKAINFGNMSQDLINDDTRYSLDLIAEMHKNLISYLDNSYKIFLHYM